MIPYGMYAQDLARARRPDGDGPKHKPGSVECPQCGSWVANPARTHRRSEGGECRGVREVHLDSLPPVNLPKRRPDASPLPVRVDRAPGPRAWGECETCGTTVTGERRFCGLCLATRMSRRRQ